MHKILIGLGLVALCTLGVAAPAHAATTSFFYTLNTSDALAPGPFDHCDGAAPGTYYYEMRTISASTSGSYAFTATTSGGFIAIYSQPFDPSAPAANCIEAYSAGTATLTADTRYWLYLSTTAQNARGSFGLTVSGTGTVSATQATTTVLSAVPNPATLGSSVTVTATVAGNLPSGSVEFFDGATSIGTGTVASGKATLAFAPTSMGTSSITAVYSGDARNFDSTSSPITLVVTPATSTTSVAASPNPATVGDTVSLTATVTGVLPTGTVEFFAGATSLGSGTMTSGIATLDYVPADIGASAITAVYSGDTQNLGSSGTVNVTVEPSTTSTSLTVAPNPANLGDTVTLSASVTGVLPTGTVEFFDGATSLGTGAVDADGGATLDYVPTATGTSVVTAAYSGDTHNLASTSPTSTLTVTLTATTTDVSIAPNPTALGTSATLTATVIGNTPTGTIEFFAGAVSIGTGTIASGVATIDYTPDAIGTASISAAYSGDAWNATSTSGSATLTVTSAVTSVTIGTTSLIATVGSPINLTATVTGHAPTGTVEFFNGTTSLGTATLSGGLATLSYTPTDAGTLSITAAYSGDSDNLASTSAGVDVTVAAAPVDPPQPGSGLASTGADSGSLVSGGVLLLLGGTALWLARRRRQVRLP